MGEPCSFPLTHPDNLDGLVLSTATGTLAYSFSNTSSRFKI